MEIKGVKLYFKEIHAAGRQGEREAVKDLVIDAFGTTALLDHRPDGAPFIIGSEKHISISHTAGVAVLAAADFPVGVDIERTDRQKQLQRIKSRFMTDIDSGSLLQAWTLKEATFKAAGVGDPDLRHYVVSANTVTINQMELSVLESSIMMGINGRDYWLSLVGRTK